MKKIAVNNVALKLLSLVLAFICWLVIINISDPTITRTFYDVPVEILNENAITSADCVYEIISGDTVNITVKGKRSVVEKIDRADFAPKADLSKLSEVNAVAIVVPPLSVPNNAEVQVEWNNAVLQVSLEKKKVKQFKVNYKTEGNVDSSYILDSVSLDTPILEVSGAASMMKKIGSVGVVVPLTGQKDGFEKELKPVLYDKEGNELSAEKVTFDNNNIKVVVSILPTKAIPVYFDVTGDPKEGYRLVQTDYQPKSIRVAGKDTELKNLRSLTLPLSIEEKNKDIEKEIDVASELRSSLKTVPGYETISVRCVIERDGRRTLSLTNSDITIVNLTENLSCTFDEKDIKYQIKILGKEEDLKNITSANLSPYLDLKGLGVGKHTVLLQYKLPNGITTKTKIKIKVTLEQMQTSDENEAMETPSQESEE